MSLLNVLKNSQKKNKPVKKVVKFKEDILVNGGESILTLDIKYSKYIGDDILTSTKSKQIEISVHTIESTRFKKYKYHFKNGLGNIVYIKTNDLSVAQQVCDYIVGDKGKYKVSSAYI